MSNVVVGSSDTPSGQRAFRWTATGGMVSLGVLPDGTYSLAVGVSADGSVVAGYSDTPSGQRAFRWTATGGMVDLGVLPDGTYSTALGVSADGSVVVGYSDDRAFRWTAAGGMVDLGVLPGGTTSAAYNVSADGAVVVGSSDTPSGQRAFRWTAAGGMVSLGVPSGGTSYMAARSISADGSVIVGFYLVGGGELAFRWTAAGGVVDLGLVPGGTESSAFSVSADGSVVVGYSVVNSNYVAFRWTAAGGMVSLGVLPGAADSMAIGVSADGSVVVGFSGDRAFLWAVAGGMVSLGVLPGGTTSIAFDVIWELYAFWINRIGTSQDPLSERTLRKDAIVTGTPGTAAVPATPGTDEVPGYFITTYYAISYPNYWNVFFYVHLGTPVRRLKKILLWTHGPNNTIIDPFTRAVILFADWFYWSIFETVTTVWIPPVASVAATPFIPATETGSTRDLNVGWNAGARTYLAHTLPFSASFKFSHDTVSSVCGINNISDADTTFSEIGWGFSFFRGNARVVERDDHHRASFTVRDGTIFKITRDADGIVKYYITDFNYEKLIFQDDGDIVTSAAHSYPNGFEITFATIDVTTGILPDTPYFVINRTANTFQLSVNRPVSVTFQISANTVTQANHGLTINTRVVFNERHFTRNISTGVHYYVVNPTNDTYQIALTEWGLPIDLTGQDGTGQILGAGTNVTFQVLANTVTLAAHGFVSGSLITFATINLTTGITNGIAYHVINPTANTFQLAQTASGAIDLFGADGHGIYGGSFINLVGDGTGTVWSHIDTSFLKCIGPAFIDTALYSAD